MSSKASSSQGADYSWGTWISFYIKTVLTAGFFVTPSWSTKQIGDQTGKVVIVTGGNSGTGYETCRALYEAGATVYLACRSAERGQKAMEDIKKGGTFAAGGIRYPKQPPQTSGKLEIMSLDLSDLNSISAFVEDFKKREKKLDILFANAGVMASPEGMRTKQGYTLQTGTNALGHQRLISLLLPTILDTARANPEHLPRIISTSSAGHAQAPKGGFDPETVVKHPSDPATSNEKPKKGKKECKKWTEYGQSKWGNIAVSNWVHWTHGPSEGKPKQNVGAGGEQGEIISVAVHPGVIATNLTQHLGAAVIFDKAPWVANLFSKDATAGASNQLWVATCPEAEARKMSGDYIVPFQKIGMARPDSYDPKRVKLLWDWCEEQGKRTE